MVAYSIFLNFVEVFTLTTFVYLYYSLSNKKTFVLLFCCLLFGFEICDILKENGIVLMSFNFIVCYGFILYKKKVFNFGDLFILGFYVFSMNILPLLIYYFLKQTLILNISTIYILVGIISKIILILFTYWLIKHLRYQIYVPNKQYFLVVITAKNNSFN